MHAAGCDVDADLTTITVENNLSTYGDCCTKCNSVITIVTVTITITSPSHLVKVVGDASPILDDADHVADGLPCGLVGLLGVHFQQVVLKEDGAG